MADQRDEKTPGRYRHVGTSPHYGAPIAPIDECRDCGAAVLDQETHDQFHRDLERRP